MRGLLLISVLGAGTSASGNSAPAPEESWGKGRGVLAQDLSPGRPGLRAQGPLLDISQSDDAKAFAKGSRELDAVTMELPLQLFRGPMAWA